LEIRKHLGMLEKRKDYLARSKDFKQKQDVVKNLSNKAMMRNPDEYYHKMNKMRKHDQTGDV